MKLFIINILKVAFVILFIFFNTVGLVKACAPDVVGRVITSTGAPVVGIWVKWTDYNNNLRYAKTDSNGNYNFLTWTYLEASIRQTYIDTDIDSDLNGSDDTKQAVIATPDDIYTQFECGSGTTKVGHAFSAVKPVSMNGTFTSITGLNFNCGKGTDVLDDIIFTPSGPAPTPIPTPAGLKTKIVNFGIVPVSGITGNVFIDDGKNLGIAMNGIRDGGEEAYKDGTEVTIIGTIYQQTTTGSDGTFAFPGIPDGNYTIFITLPPNFHSTNETSKSVLLPPGNTASFGIVSSYTIKGNVYNDTNKNLIFEAGESRITNAKIESTGGFVLAYNGYYEVQDLIAGQYTVSYTTPLPKGFYYLHPKPAMYPAIYNITVGSGCNTDTTTGSFCQNDSIENLNFAITDSMPWLQSYGLDMRFDNGFDNLLPAPAATTCGQGSFASGTIPGVFDSPGIIFIGDGSAEFGQGSASNNNRVAGGMSYPEVYRSKPSLITSASNLLLTAAKAGIEVVRLDSKGYCKNPDTKCNIPQGLEKGFYHVVKDANNPNGDLLLDNNLNFITGNYVIVADGTITLTNGMTVSVTNGATLLMAAGKDIIIDKTIHASANSCPVPAGQLQGVFSADEDIIIQGNNGSCVQGADTMLNIDGTFIVNAAKNGGELIRQRDLCGDNPKYPSLTFKARPDFILNVPGFLTQQQTVSHEETP